MEEILVHGRVRMDQSVEAMAYSLIEQLRAGSDTADDEISDDELAESKDKIRATFVEMAKKRYISRVHPLDMTVEKKKEQAEFPACIAKGMDSGNARGGEAHKRGAAATGADNGASTDGKDDDSNGITVRASKRKKAAEANNNSTIPVELQMMLEADDVRRKEDESEAEYDFGDDGGRTRTAKKRKLSKKAKLPTRGAAAAAATAGSGDSEDGDAAAGTAMGEKSLVWRYGLDQFMRDLRHRACIKFAKENINNVAGVVVAAMLQHSSPHERERDEPTSFPVSARELYAMPAVQEALPKDSKDTWRLLLNYITVMCRDKSGMVMKVAADAASDASTNSKLGDGGKYVVHMKKIVDFLKQHTSHSYVQEKFGTPSARILRLLMDKRQMEQKTIGEVALLPSNDTRKRLFEMYAEHLVKLQEIPKRADHNPAFTVFCWSVDVPKLERLVTERIQDSLGKLRRRRKHEAHENKDLIARSDQLVEAHDLAKFDKLSRALDRLDRAILQLGEMLMLYRDF